MIFQRKIQQMGILKFVHVLCTMDFDQFFLDSFLFSGINCVIISYKTHNGQGLRTTTAGAVKPPCSQKTPTSTSLMIGIQCLMIGLVFVLASSFSSLKCSETCFMIFSYNCIRSSFNCINSVFNFFIFSAISGFRAFISSATRLICFGMISYICSYFSLKLCSSYNKTTRI